MYSEYIQRARHGGKILVIAECVCAGFVGMQLCVIATLRQLVLYTCIARYLSKAQAPARQTACRQFSLWMDLDNPTRTGNEFAQ
jgi:hypothetical protein